MRRESSKTLVATLIVVVFVVFSNVVSVSLGSILTCSGVAPVPFGSTSILDVKYQYQLTPSAASTPVVADVNGDSYPEVFVLDGYGSANALTALQLVSGSFQLMWQQRSVLAFSHIAVARVPNTPNSWIVCSLSDYTVMSCFDALTGSLVFTQPFAGGVDLSTPNIYGVFSAVAIESLFPSDPNIYILVPTRVFKYSFVGGVSTYCDIPFSQSMEIPFAMDIDLDGNSELFYSNCIYSSLPPCAIIWCDTYFNKNAGDPGVTSAVANMDADPEGEVVMCGYERLVVHDHDGGIKWDISLPSFGKGGPPTIADFDGDGTSDVAVTSQGFRNIFNGIDGSLIGQLFPTSSTAFQPMSSFDFQYDGISELIHDNSDASYVRSTSWALSASRSGLTGSEYPIIADIDLDGIADIVSVADNLSVITSPDRWAGSGSFWSQHGFNDMNHDQQYFPQVTQVSNIFRSTPAVRLEKTTTSSWFLHTND